MNPSWVAAGSSLGSAASLACLADAMLSTWLPMAWHRATVPPWDRSAAQHTARSSQMHLRFSSHCPSPPGISESGCLRSDLTGQTTTCGGPSTPHEQGKLAVRSLGPKHLH